MCKSEFNNSVNFKSLIIKQSKTHDEKGSTKLFDNINMLAIPAKKTLISSVS